MTGQEIAHRGAIATPFTDLAEEAIPRGLRLARSTGCTVEEAKDVVQDALLMAWRHRDQLRGPFLPWFLSIVYRRARRRRRWLTVAGGWRQRAADWPPDTSLDPAVRATLRALGDRQRTALWLRYGLDASTAEVALVLGTTEAAAKQLLYRARESFRRAMSEVTAP